MRLSRRTFDDGVVAFDPLTYETHSFSPIAGFLIEFAQGCAAPGATLDAAVEACLFDEALDPEQLRGSVGEVIDSLVSAGWLEWQ